MIERLEQLGIPRRRRGTVWLIAAGVVVAAAATWFVFDGSTRRNPTDPRQRGAIATSPRPSDSDSARCTPVEHRPTYLPWIEEGEQVPPPQESYDAEIDRAQLSWSNSDPNPRVAGVGLTRYPHIPAGNFGEPANVSLAGTEGRLHSEDEGGLISIFWDVESDECNFVELILHAPGLSDKDAIDELKRIATSLREP